MRIERETYQTLEINILNCMSKEILIWCLSNPNIVGLKWVTVGISTHMFAYMCVYLCLSNF